MNAALDNIGASVSHNNDHDRDSVLEAVEHPVNASLEQVMRNPLAVGLEEDIRRTEREVAATDAQEDATRIISGLGNRKILDGNELS